MPVLDGMGAIVQIHRTCNELCIQPVLVIAVAGSDSSTLHDECLSIGMTSVVMKPFTDKDLIFGIYDVVHQIETLG